MPRPRPLALALALTFAACLEVNPGYLGPTTGTTSDAATAGTTAAATGETTTTASTTSVGTTTSPLTSTSLSGEGCGNGLVDPGEACDDGRNGDQDDGCTDLCTAPACGDDLLQPSLGEQCDEGPNNADTAACTASCKVATCGDGLVHAGSEECDDGNLVGEDGCEPYCSPLSIVEMSVGADFTCALLSHGKIRCWGNNDTGQLGLGDKAIRGDGPGELPTAYVDLGEGYVLDIASGADSTCAVFSFGVVRCWGGNSSGERGVCSTEPAGDGFGPMPPDNAKVGESVRVIGGGGGFYCAGTYGDDVRCWGNNTSGQLGLQIPYDMNNIGDQPNELPRVDTVAINFTPVTLNAGTAHLCALSDLGDVHCWGSASHGQLGYENKNDVGDNGEDLPNSSVKVDANAADVIQVAAGFEHTCVLRNTLKVRCWGSGGSGRLGTGSVADVGADPGTMPPADIDLGGDVLQIALGAAHGCALMQGGAVRCWGANSSGQLGIGSTQNIGDEPGELPPADVPLGATATAIYSGPNADHTCAVLSDRTVRCWGANDSGQLGIGSTETIGDDETPDAAPITPVAP